MSKLRRDEWILAAVAVGLVADLLFLPWFDLDIATPSATGDPDGWLGVLATLCAALLVLDLAIDRLLAGAPAPGASTRRVTTRLTFAVAAAGFVCLKFLLHAHFRLLAWGFYVGILLSVALVVLAAQSGAEGAEVSMPPPAPPAAP